MGTTAEVRATGLAGASGHGDSAGASGHGGGEGASEHGGGEGATALDRAFGALTLVDDQMSLWKESDLTRLNAAGFATVPAELFFVVCRALDVAVASEGAFDPTVEPLVRATGGLGGPHRSLAEDERRTLLARVGASRVHLDLATRAIRLDAGTALDLGGIAKGYAADLALAALQGAGARSGLVDLGSSSIAVFGSPLVVDVRDPEAADAQAWASFVIDNASVSTSGGDQRPGHIVDPRTGLPAAGVLSATVVAATGIEADALSTAVYVLGADAGLRLLARRGADGLVLARRGGRAVVRATPGFERKYDLRVRGDVTLE